MKKFFVGIVVLLVVGASYFVVRAFNPPRPTPFDQLPVAEQQKRRADAQKLVTQVETVARDAKAGKTGTFELKISDEQLNTLLQDRIKGKNLPVHDLAASLEPGTVVLNGTADYKGFTAPVVLRGTLQPQAGGVQFNVDSLTLAGLPAPDGWKTKVQKAVGEAFDKVIRTENNVAVDSIDVTSGEVTVKGKTGRQ